MIGMRSDMNHDARTSTVTRSFRFENELSKILDEEAERMGISINALVGIILRRYCEFTRYLSKIDMIVINREFLTFLLGTYDEILQSDGRIVVIRHRLGRKGSIFFQAYFHSAFKTILNVDAKFEITDSSLKFDIRDKSDYSAS